MIIKIIYMNDHIFIFKTTQQIKQNIIKCLYILLNTLKNVIIFSFFELIIISDKFSSLS